MAIHQIDKRDWPRLTWKFPLIHNFNFGFGLDADDTAATKNSTIVPYMWHNNSIIDYQDIETNPENGDFAVVAYGDVAAGSYVPSVQVNWEAYLRTADTEITFLRFDTMRIGISMLNRLDAFDKKTGEDIETILELTHDTGDEMTKVLWNTVKVYEAGGIYDIAPKDGFADIGLGVSGQPEGVAFDKEKFFDAMHYYTNKEMLKMVTDRMRSHVIADPATPHGRAFARSSTNSIPSLCKMQHPYQFCGELFSIPQAGSRTQYHIGGETTALEHLTVKGMVRFNEFNPDFNFARA